MCGDTFPHAFNATTGDVARQQQLEGTATRRIVDESDCEPHDAASSRTRIDRETRTCSHRGEACDDGCEGFLVACREFLLVVLYGSAPASGRQ